MRTIIELTDAQVAALKAFCARKRISRAEAIRRAVDRMVAEEDAEGKAHKRAFESAFGIWKHDARNAREIVDELRSEWDTRP